MTVQLIQPYASCVVAVRSDDETIQTLRSVKKDSVGILQKTRLMVKNIFIWSTPIVRPVFSNGFGWVTSVLEKTGLRKSNIDVFEMEQRSLFKRSAERAGFDEIIFDDARNIVKCVRHVILLDSEEKTNQFDAFLSEEMPHVIYQGSKDASRIGIERVYTWGHGQEYYYAHESEKRERSLAHDAMLAGFASIHFDKINDTITLCDKRHSVPDSNARDFFYLKLQNTYPRSTLAAHNDTTEVWSWGRQQTMKNKKKTNTSPIGSSDSLPKKDNSS